MTTATKAEAGTNIDYTDAQYDQLIKAGANPRPIGRCDGVVPFNVALDWAASRQDMIAKAQQYATDCAEELARLAAIAAALPIKPVPGNNDTDTYKRKTKSNNIGDRKSATGGLISVVGGPPFTIKCSPGQIVAILANPAAALTVATEVDNGDYDGTGFQRTSQFSVATQLAALTAHYDAQPAPPACEIPSS
jgi:hypothetical protein